MTCFDPNCQQRPKYDIRGLKLCPDHYIEALEHSGHLSSLVTGNDHPIRVSLPVPKKVLDKGPVF